jgi:transposase
VHAAKIVAAVLDAETGEIAFFGLTGDTVKAAGFCAGLPRPVRVAYEAGPTGYGLARELVKRRGECVVAAPSKIPRASGDRVKTDRRDAELLVRLLHAGKLHAVRVPGAEEEALRDLLCSPHTARRARLARAPSHQTTRKPERFTRQLPKRQPAVTGDHGHDFRRRTRHLGDQAGQ